MRFREDQAKSILFASKHKIKISKKLNRRHQDIKIKQHFEVAYLDCVLD